MPRVKKSSVVHGVIRGNPDHWQVKDLEISTGQGVGTSFPVLLNGYLCRLRVEANAVRLILQTNAD